MHRLGNPRVVPASRQRPGAEVLLVLGLALKGRVRRLVLAARPAARLRPLHLPGAVVLPHHRVRGARAGGGAGAGARSRAAPARGGRNLAFAARPRRRPCCPGNHIPFALGRLRFYGDRARRGGRGRLLCRLRRLLVRRLGARVLGGLRVLGENQRHGDVCLVQLVPEAGDAAGARDARPRHGARLRASPPSSCSFLKQVPNLPQPPGPRPANLVLTVFSLVA